MMNTEIIARLEAAEVGSRELDVRVVAACSPSEWGIGDLEIALEDPDRRLNPPHFTTSIDAALALAERVLPGWFVGIQHNRGVENASQWSSYIDAAGCDEICGDAHTPSLALCIAILRALDAQEKK